MFRVHSTNQFGIRVATTFVRWFLWETRKIDPFKTKPEKKLPHILARGFGGPTNSGKKCGVPSAFCKRLCGQFCKDGLEVGALWRRSFALAPKITRPQQGQQPCVPMGETSELIAFRPHQLKYVSKFGPIPRLVTPILHFKKHDWMNKSNEVVMYQNVLRFANNWPCQWLDSMYASIMFSQMQCILVS